MGEFNVDKTTGDLELTAGADNYTPISYADWLELTPQEQETGKWDVTGVPGADGTISIDLMTKLWENPNPTQAFASQNITLSSSDYDALLITYKSAYNSVRVCSQIAPKEFGSTLNIAEYANGTPANRVRYITPVNATQFSIGDASSNAVIDNSMIIPLIIYGIKLRRTVEIKAIAPEVSTLASKCMMSDGVTSAEDAVNEVTSRISANDLHDRVSLAGYTVDNKYTCPTDGYVFVVNVSDKDAYLVIDNLISIGSNKGRFATFVRKGTQVWNVNTPDYVYFTSIR